MTYSALDRDRELAAHRDVAIETMVRFMRRAWDLGKRKAEGVVRFTQTVLTNMIMIQNPQDGRVVAQLRTKKDWGGVTLPGGHVEPGESMLEAVRREAFEETGLTVGAVEFCGISHWRRDADDARNIVLMYRTTDYAGELCEDSEEGRVFWVSLEELQAMELSNMLEPMLEVILRGNASEAYGVWVEDFSAPMTVQ